MQEFAAAKLNLYLHVLGRRADGYHLLDSLVVFTALGDTLTFTPDDGNALRLIVDGPFADELRHVPPQENLAVRAIASVAQACGANASGTLHMTKRLPLAAGLGGGSADAAAALRIAARHWGLAADKLPHIALTLGHDVPCCVYSKPCFFGNTGDEISLAPQLPTMGVLLVNPRVSVPTPLVFKNRSGAFSSDGRFSENPATANELGQILASRRNDLSAAACVVAPVIRDVLAHLAELPDCLLSRMAGSGATCFALFETKDHALTAAELIKTKQPNWWVEASSF